MKIKFTDDLDCDTVTLTCSMLEFALFNAALNAFLQLDSSKHDNPQDSSLGNIANPEDIELANELEQQMFKAYCSRWPAGHADPPLEEKVNVKRLNTK